MGILNFDILTLIKLIALGNGIILVLLLVYRNELSIKKAYVSFRLSKVFQGCAWVLLAMRGVIPDALLVYVGNSILVVGVSLEVLGIISIEKFSRFGEFLYASLSIVFISVFCIFARQPYQYTMISSFFSP